ncbi:MAG: uncharacterized protein KVP18_005140 [Porospora cf. gigantea A]|uniref:uncharacterized protein n=1 Tax=Porospora cf. gigantea A TaxID=2853593 RepID=UPI00355A2DF6|nr:MAG: hypothetical protein KVP18_005140 [Porospora cf. gigantea A]
MAWNPTLNPLDLRRRTVLVPTFKTGESWLMLLDGVKIDIRPVKGPRRVRRGYLLLTNFRLVFVTKGALNSHKRFSAFETAHALTRGVSSEYPQYVQPFFGRNYFEGYARPSVTSTYPVEAQFRIWFSVPIMKFLDRYYELWSEEIIHRRGVPVTEEEFAAMVEVTRSAFVNPNDPSVIYHPSAVKQ